MKIRAIICCRILVCADSTDTPWENSHNSLCEYPIHAPSFDSETRFEYLRKSVRVVSQLVLENSSFWLEFDHEPVWQILLRVLGSIVNWLEIAT